MHQKISPIFRLDDFEHHVRGQVLDQFHTTSSAVLSPLKPASNNPDKWLTYLSIVHMSALGRHID